MKKILFYISLFLVETALVGCGILSILKLNNILGGILIAVAVILFAIIIVKYNNMIKYKNKISEALSLVDIQLKLRFDLVPNLVEVVKGYSKHEKDVLKEVVGLRQLALQANTEQEKIEYANKLVDGINNVIAIAENHPKLKANDLYSKLMEQLVDIEDRIVASRRIYDSNVNSYNSLIQTFPNNILASIYGFEKATLFKIKSGEKINVKIDLGGDK